MSALDKYRRVSVVLGIPSNGFWHDDFGMCMCNLIGFFNRTAVPGYRDGQTLIPFNTKGSILSRSRRNIVRIALERKATHVLFLDSDQTFPPDVLHRLLAADKDIVAANIATKQLPASPTARKHDGTFFGALVYTDEQSTGLERVWRVGTGIMLVKRRVFEALGPKDFEIRWKPDIEDYMGEDWAFVEAAEGAGFECWIDHDLSKQVSHIGMLRYTHDYVGEVKRVEVVNG